MSAFLAAMQLLTVIPVRAPYPQPRARAAVLFPVVGALLGLLAVATWRLLDPVVPRGLLALLTLALWTLVTGGLHEDGLADTFDAFGGGRSREDILRILKDSRIGAFGALALIFSVIARWQALAVVAPAQVTSVLIAAQTLPRAGIVALGAMSGPAGEGLGAEWAGALNARHAIASCVLALALVAPFAKWGIVAFAVASLAIVVLSSLYFRKRIGGITGDCLGAIAQLQEIAILVIAACS